ncbi:hypothetical protein AB0C15_21735 [Micromonospora sp. NPDC048835]|uniref:hypothetical protein n=1 Tax=Micromonospora sp. NPDC048835 TaxID=3155147 RepID=UPI0033FAFFEF
MTAARSRTAMGTVLESMMVSGTPGSFREQSVAYGGGAHAAFGVAGELVAGDQVVDAWRVLPSMTPATEYDTDSAVGWPTRRATA